MKYWQEHKELILAGVLTLAAMFGWDQYRASRQATREYQPQVTDLGTCTERVPTGVDSLSQLQNDTGIPGMSWMMLCSLKGEVHYHVQARTY